MTEWKAKRFWKTATVAAAPGGYTVQLDGRPVKTPAKAPLEVPTEALAAAIAAEWDAQEGEVDPGAMPATRSANAAIDKVRPQHAAVAEMIAAYGDTDLLCYRADAPEGLVQRQAEAWDPLLAWAERDLGARLRPVTGVMHAPQDAAALAALTAQVRAMDAFALTAFHDLVSLTGSLILGFAAVHDQHPPETLWALSRLDETWQEEFWGVDEEARQTALRKQSDFLHAKRFHDISRPAR
jgi:chaperone required for assembly of F1-ATPase